VVLIKRADGENCQCSGRARAANARVAALLKRWDRLRVGLDLTLQERGADMADLPGGASGLLVRDYKGKEAIGW
jgi:hypothetical protein